MILNLQQIKTVVAWKRNYLLSKWQPVIACEQKLYKFQVDKMILDEKQRAKVKWSCRRGMLELDVLLMPFFENCFDALLPNEQRDFIKLLDCDDNTLFKWFMHQGTSDDAALANLVERIVSYRKAQL